MTNLKPPKVLGQRDRRTFLLEADLDGDEVLEEDIVNVGVVQVKELLQLRRLSVLCKTTEAAEDRGAKLLQAFVRLGFTVRSE